MAVMMDNTSRAGHHLEFEVVGTVLGEVRDKITAHSQALTVFRNTVGQKMDVLATQVSGLETPIVGTNTVLGQIRASIEAQHTALRDVLMQQLGALQGVADGLTASFSDETGTFSTQLRASLEQIRGELAALQTAVQTAQQPLPQWLAAR